MHMKSPLQYRLSYLFLKLQAVLLLAIGKRTAALSRFDRMLLHWSEDGYALASRAHVLVQLNQPDDALASLQHLTCITGSGPQKAAAWFNLGYVLQQAGRHEDAGAAFQKALDYQPRMDRAWYGLALVLIHQRRFHDAIDALLKNTALQPMSPHGWYRLAQVWLALGEPGKAAEVVARLRQFEPRVAAQLERENCQGQALHSRPEKRCGPVPVATASGMRDAAH